MVFLVLLIFVINRAWPLGGESTALALVGDSTKGLGMALLSLDPTQFEQYVLPFEIASVLLLAAMVGAIIIARDNKG